MTCQNSHRYWGFLESLPAEQGTDGRHKCCGCAYEEGYRQGFHLQNATFNPDVLPQSQAGVVRHKSAHAAFAKGYQDGVTAHYMQGV